MVADQTRLSALGLPAGFNIAVLTGAGISAESGIPTFRGKDGIWTARSRDYRPQELATLRAFQQMPRDLWRWYLYRRGACRRAQPNAGHVALRTLADRLGPQRFTLVTQNVDGLHTRSGIGAGMLFEIHGCIEAMRCTLPCTPERFPLDPSLVLASREAELDDACWERLKCPHCGALARPHVLWFDEYYDEALYGSDSALARAAAADLLLVIGTSGATTLPMMMVERALRQDCAIIEVNPEPSAFTAAIQRHARGLYLARTASACVPALVDGLTALHSTAG